MGDSSKGASIRRWRRKAAQGGPEEETVGIASDYAEPRKTPVKGRVQMLKPISFPYMASSGSSGDFRNALTCITTGSACR